MAKLLDLFARRCAERETLDELAASLFEEVCAKTLYNLSGAPAPFDPDSPYWIVPNAFALARSVGIEPAEILAVVST